MPGRSLLFYYLIISGALMFLDYFGILKIVKSPLDIVVNPIKRTVFVTSIFVKEFGHVLYTYPQIKQLNDDFIKIQKSNLEITQQINFLTQENVKLRAQLEAPLPSSFKFIVADVTAVSRFMDVAVGEKDGVKKDMAVVDGRILLGKVKSVTEGRSQIILLNDPDISVLAKTSRGTLGVVTGQFNNNILMGKILQKDQLFLDDEVVTAGSDTFPPNLVIGKITHITVDDTAPYKQGKIASPLDFKKENKVFIISNL